VFDDPLPDSLSHRFPDPLRGPPASPPAC
jgi:hypothetical protein